MSSKSSQLILNQPARRLKSKQNNRPSLLSSPNTPRDLRQTETLIVSRNTFNFEDLNAKPGSAVCKDRIHGKRGTKRSGGKVVLVGQRQKKQTKETSVSKLKNSDKSILQKDFRNSFQENNVQDAIFIKSYQVENQYNSFVEDRPTPTLPDNTPKQKLPTSAAPTPNSTNQDQLFKQLRRKMAAQKELFKNNSQQKSCFFANLKRKLKLQMNRIQEKQDYDRLNFLIEGCNAHVHTKTTSRDRHISAKLRPQTAGSAQRVNQTKDEEKRARPLTARAKSYISLEGSRLVKDLKSKTLTALRSNRKQRHTTKQKSNDEVRSVRDAGISSCTDSLVKRKKHSQNLTEDNQKMAKILNECQKEFTKKQHLRDNMKIFQFYCKKMDARFQRVSNQLQQVQNFQIQ